jgi:hypothetical protein
VADVKYRAQCIFSLDSTLPRDQLVINPCFLDHGVTSNPSNLASDLATALEGWYGTASVLPITVKLYDIEGSKPVAPAAIATRNSTLAPPSAGCPREIAVCLSFYAGQNVPRKRGRLYVPAALLGGMPSSLALRPSSTVRNKVKALAPVFASLGGVDVDWIVWSRAGNAFNRVTNYYVDDEWDTVRSRGLRPTLRDAATTTG